MDSADSTQTPSQPVPVIGVLGGVGSGKSSVARRIVGGCVIDADRIGHELLHDQDVRDEIVAAFGADVLSADGRIDRALLANRVFGQSASATSRRGTLERILHPRIRQEVERQIANRDSVTRYILLDAALLLEAGWGASCDALIYVDTLPSVRLERVAKNRQWTAAELSRREAAQLPHDEKRSRADFIVDNSGSIAEAAQQLQLWLDSGLPRSG